jgi:hypothetical protein
MGKKTLVIDFNATQSGKLYVNLPRSLLDALQDGEDIKYTVFVDGRDASADVVEVTKFVKRR